MDGLDPSVTATDIGTAIRPDPIDVVAYAFRQSSGIGVVVVDDLSRGHRTAVDPDVPFYQGCIGDRAMLTGICREHRIEACIHFAALAYVGRRGEKGFLLKSLGGGA